MAQSIIQIKRSLGNAAPGQLRPGEFAYSAAETGQTGTTAGVLYIGGPSANSQGFATTNYIIGGTKYTSLLDVTAGKATAGKAVVLDDKGGIDTIHGVQGESGETKLVIGLPDTENQKVVIHDPYVKNKNGEIIKLDTFIDQFVKDGVITLTAGDGIAEITNKNGTYNIALKPTGAQAGTYGSETKIPSFTINQYGQVTNIEEKTISTSMSVENAGGDKQGTVDLLTGKLVVGDGMALDVETTGTAKVAVDDTVVRTAGEQSIAGVKTFSDAAKMTAAQTEIKSAEGSNELAKMDTMFKQIVNKKGKTTKSAGGIPVGADLSNKTLLEIIGDMLYSYQATTNVRLTAANPTGGVFEAGTVKNITDATVAWNAGSTQVTKAEVLVGGVVKGTAQVSAGTSAKVTLDSPIEIGSTGVSTTTITGRVWDDEGKKSYSGGSISWTYVYPFYHGVAPAAGEVTDEMIKGMNKHIEAKGNKKWTFTANNQRCVFAYPASHGNIHKIFDQNNFDVTSTFTKSTVQVTGLDNTAQTYNVYMNEAATIDGFAFDFRF